MTYVLGCDISRYQGAVDFAKMKAAGARFVICRATVGDYYTDPTLQANIRGARAAGLVAGAYLVAAPADTAGRRISAAEHLRRFKDAIEWLPINMRHTVDNELTRGQDPWWITTVTQGVFQGLPAFNGRKAANYTRQSWWDANLRAWSGWGDYDLFAARYLGGRMTDKPSPWWDGQYKFRDYGAWKLWQFSAKGNGLGHAFGCESADVDLDVFNGTWDEFVAWSGAQDAEPPEDDDMTIDLTPIITRLDRIIELLAAQPAPDPEPDPEPPATGRVRVTADKALAHNEIGRNNANPPKPIMAIYETPRIRFDNGREIATIGLRVDADGQDDFWEIHNPAQYGAPAGVRLYLQASKVVKLA